jgi:nicotinamide-nucleotide amidase
METTIEMAIGVLQKTREASLSAAITGHLGPEAPPEVDGKIFVAVANGSPVETKIVASESFQLTSQSRVDRQFESASHVFKLLVSKLDSRA